MYLNYYSVLGVCGNSAHVLFSLSSSAVLTSAVKEWWGSSWEAFSCREVLRWHKCHLFMKPFPTVSASERRVCVTVPAWEQVGNQLDQGMKAFLSAVVRTHGMGRKSPVVVMDAQLGVWEEKQQPSSMCSGFSIKDSNDWNILCSRKGYILLFLFRKSYKH